MPLRPVGSRSTAKLDAVGAPPSDLYRALANQPDMLAAWIDFAWGLRQKAMLPRALRELLVLRSAQLHGSSYIWSDHVTMAEAEGVPGDQMESLSQWETSPLFDQRSRSALRLCEEMIAGSVSDDALEGVEQHFDPGERVELILTIGFYCMVPRVLDALRLTAEE
ncbi:MAG: carboxymuconolactone decarboxylase family protein [Acidimicrobiia bacterium]